MSKARPTAVPSGPHRSPSRSIPLTGAEPGATRTTTSPT